MPPVFDNDGSDGPEKLVYRLSAQLRNYVLWDALLVFSPPGVAAIYLVVYLFRASWFGPLGFFLMIVIAASAGLLAVLVRYRPSIPSASSAARLVDQRAGAQDRFLTLATIAPSQSVPAFVSRLRIEAAEFQSRIELKRDFPYQIKRSFYWSLLASLSAALLFQLLLPVVHSITHPVPASERLRELAEKMTQRPRLSELARGLQSLATKLEEPKISPQEKQSLVREMQKKVEEQQRNPQQKDNQDLLGEASSTLQGLEQSGSGRNQREDQEKGSGGIKSNLPQEGQGEGKQSQGKGGDSKSDQSAQLGKETDSGKSTQAAPQDQSQESNRQKTGDGKANQPDSNKPDPSQTKEATGKAAGNAAEFGGKSKTSEEIPRGAPPAERFNPAGEGGKEGIKGAGYVTVQLPEELAADAKGESTVKREGGRDGKVRPKLPVSNVPLPAHLPDAPTEKQPLPLEYRGMIR
jgi:hypothetical protein